MGHVQSGGGPRALQRAVGLLVTMLTGLCSRPCPSWGPASSSWAARLQARPIPQVSMPWAPTPAHGLTPGQAWAFRRAVLVACRPCFRGWGLLLMRVLSIPGGPCHFHPHVSTAFLISVIPDGIVSPHPGSCIWTSAQTMPGPGRLCWGEYMDAHHPHTHPTHTCTHTHHTHVHTTHMYTCTHTMHTYTSCTSTRHTMYTPYTP